VRLDTYLAAHGYFESRNRALEAIRSGKVTVNSAPAKASQKVSEADSIKVTQEKFYVSRAARKLEAFLDTFPQKFQDRHALDIGSSTGGFAQILLEQGVAALSCVDVGSDQLHHSLRTNPKLTLYEETDIRIFRPMEVFDLITCDVSFISILQIIEDIDRLADSGTDILILYKPQFEVGRGVKRNSKGVLSDTEAITACQRSFLAKTKVLHWNLLHQAPSQITGKEGNVEYFYAFRKEAT